MATKIFKVLLFKNPSPTTFGGLCFTAGNTMGATYGDSIEMTASGSISRDIKYSTDGSTWNTFTPGTTKIILANAGDKVYFKGNNPSGFNTDTSNYLRFKISTNVFGGDPIIISGNINSLLDDGDGSTITAIPNNYCYYKLFYEAGTKIDIDSGLKLPATTLTEGCYMLMFSETSVKSSPELPATNLAKYCYGGMFEYSSITQPPALPATNLAEACYMGMFADSELTSAPELPATTLTQYCYRGMFMRCTSLTTAPELKATTLVNNCYYSMFHGCSNLNYIKLSYTGNFEDSYFHTWVSNVAATGDFYYEGNDSTVGVSAIPEGWTLHNATKFNVLFTVVDDSSVPIQGATISINSSSYMTDSNGQATALNLTIDNSYSYTISKTRYITSTGSVTSSTSGTINKNVTLAEATIVCDSVTSSPLAGVFIETSAGEQVCSNSDGEFSATALNTINNVIRGHYYTTTGSSISGDTYNIVDQTPDLTNIVISLPELTSQYYTDTFDKFFTDITDHNMTNSMINCQNSSVSAYTMTAPGALTTSTAGLSTVNAAIVGNGNSISLFNSELGITDSNITITDLTFQSYGVNERFYAILNLSNDNVTIANSNITNIENVMNIDSNSITIYNTIIDAINTVIVGSSIDIAYVLDEIAFIHTIIYGADSIRFMNGYTSFINSVIDSSMISIGGTSGKQNVTSFIDTYINDTAITKDNVESLITLNSGEHLIYVDGVLAVNKIIS